MTGRAWSCLLAGVFITAASLLYAFGARTNAQDADSLLTAVMSVEKLTWYYWGQNRFANLLPLLASPFRDIGVNLHVQVFLRNVGGFGSVFFVLLLLGDRELLLERFLAAILVMLAAAPGFVLFNAPVPQPVSCAVFAAGLWLAERPAGAAPAWRLAVGAALFWVAFLVNIALLVIVIPISLAHALLGRHAAPLPLGRPAVCASVVGAAAAAYAHALFFLPRTPGGLALRWDGLNAAANVIAGEINLTAACLLLLPCCVLAACRGWRGTGVTAPLAHLVTLLAAVVASGVYANLVWVQLNGNAAKYYIIPVLVLVVTLASWLASLLRHARVLGHPAMCAAMAAMAMAAVALRTGSPVGGFTYVTGIPGRELALNDDLPQIVRHVPPDVPMVVIGNYWLATPLVYERIRVQGNRESYAVTDHWAPMAKAVRTLAASGRPFALVCLAVEAGACKAELEGPGGAGIAGRRFSAGFSAVMGSGGTVETFAANGS